MVERRQQIGQLRVLLRVFAGKAVEQVPLNLDSGLGKPLQRLQVLHPAHSFIDQFEDRRAEGLDSQLGAPHARLQQQVGLRRVILVFISNM